MLLRLHQFKFKLDYYKFRKVNVTPTIIIDKVAIEYDKRNLQRNLIFYYKKRPNTEDKNAEIKETKLSDLQKTIGKMT